LAQPERLIFLNREGHAPKLRDTVDSGTANGHVLTWDSTSQSWYPSSGGSSSAPSDADYIVFAANAELSNERVFTPQNGVKMSDGGAGGNLTVELGFGGTEAAGDMLLRGDTGYERLSIGSTSNVLQVNNAGAVVWDKPRVADPMVWASSELCYKRDGVRVLATVPFNASNAPSTAAFKFRCVISCAMAGVTIRVRLYNATNGEYVTNANLTTSSLSPTTLTSVSLTVGDSSGDLRDSLTAYEIHADIIGDDGFDFGIVGFAGMTIQ
jgi:hypothetical protein